MNIVTILITLYGGYGLWYLLSAKFGYNAQNEKVDAEDNPVVPTQPRHQNEGKQHPVTDISEPEATPVATGSTENVIDTQLPVADTNLSADDATPVKFGETRIDENNAPETEDQNANNDDVRLVNNGGQQDVVMNMNTLVKAMVDNYMNGYNDAKKDLNGNPELDSADPNDDAWESDYADESSEEREEGEEIGEREMERDNPSTDEDDADWDAASPQYSIDGTSYDNWNHRDDEDDDEYTKYYS